MNLLTNAVTPGCGEGKCSIYSKAPYEESWTVSTKPELFSEFQQSLFKAKIHEGCPRAWNQLVHNSDWLIMRYKDGVTEANLMNPEAPTDLGTTLSMSRSS